MAKNIKLARKIKVNVKVSKGNVQTVTFVAKPLVVTAKAKGQDRITVMPNPTGKGFIGHTRHSGSWAARTPARAFARTVKHAWA